MTKFDSKYQSLRWIRNRRTHKPKQTITGRVVNDDKRRQTCINFSLFIMLRPGLKKSVMFKVLIRFGPVCPIAASRSAMPCRSCQRPPDRSMRTIPLRVVSRRTRGLCNRKFAVIVSTFKSHSRNFTPRIFSQVASVNIEVNVRCPV